jgi:hypothetical protein
LRENLASPLARLFGRDLGLTNGPATLFAKQPGSNRPDRRVVGNPELVSEGDNTFWTKVGTPFEDEDGKGFNIILLSAMLINCPRHPRAKAAGWPVDRRKVEVPPSQPLI